MEKASTTHHLILKIHSLFFEMYETAFQTSIIKIR